jgi:hypothetical protein
LSRIVIAHEEEVKSEFVKPRSRFPGSGQAVLVETCVQVPNAFAELLGQFDASRLACALSAPSERVSEFSFTRSVPVWSVCWSA